MASENCVVHGFKQHCHNMLPKWYSKQKGE